ncbi:MAG TPA: hypothetical protein VD963_06605 [Phycisphaerales bacterium]|nr:hypothetical protein [Phycisphaerales bacterium]
MCAGVALGAGGGAGAGEQPERQRSNERLREEGEKVFARPGARDAGAARESAADAWSIILYAFRGPDARALATEALRATQTQGRLPEAFIQERGESVVIALGRFAGPDDPEAQAEIARVKRLVVERSRPYDLAFLAPPYKGTLLGARPEYNLVSAAAQFPGRAKYTLQVGFYGREELASPSEADLRESRRAAEEAAARLRAEGELAYYFHGPKRSMVLVGVFDETDFDPQTPRFRSPRLVQTQKRFPHNLYNGKAMKARSREREWLVGSELVAIPEAPGGLAARTDAGAGGRAPEAPSRSEGEFRPGVKSPGAQKPPTRRR